MTKTHSLGELALLVNGEVRGDAALQISGFAAIEKAGPHELTMMAHAKFEAALRMSHAGAVICRDELPWFQGSQLLAANPYLAMAMVVELLMPRYRPAPSIHPTAVIEPGVQLGKDCSIGAHVVIGENSVIGDRVVLFPGVIVGPDCRIGDDAVIHPHAVIMDKVEIGRRVLINANAVIGSDGYGFVFDGERHRKIPQVGKVIIEDDVELGAGVTIDRATLGETRIGKGTKTDNQVHIAHNVTVGEHCLLIAQTGISGSTAIGNHVTLAGQVGVGGHLTIGDHVIAAARTGIMRDVPEHAVIAGFPALDHMQWKRIQTIILQLPILLQRIRELERKAAAAEIEEEDEPA